MSATFVAKQIYHGGSHHRSLRHYVNFCMPILVYGLSITKSKNFRNLPGENIEDFNQGLLDIQRTILIQIGNYYSSISKKIIHNFQINSLCTKFCNFVKESTPSFIEFSRRSTFRDY